MRSRPKVRASLPVPVFLWNARRRSEILLFICAQIKDSWFMSTFIKKRYDAAQRKIIRADAQDIISSPSACRPFKAVPMPDIRLSAVLKSSGFSR